MVLVELRSYCTFLLSVSGPSKQPSCGLSGGKPALGVVGLSYWGLRSAGIRGLLHVLAAASAAAATAAVAASTTTALAFYVWSQFVLVV